MFTAREKWILFILAAMQFVHMLDFVIMMPLSPQFMSYFHISTARFGLLVSAYTFAAGLSSFFGAFYIDRYDRKHLIQYFFAGFILGTLLCALSPSYEIFLLARVLSGVFGGLMTALVMSIIGDVFPPERRGTATGTVMMAFSLVTVLGVPAGLLLKDLASWHLPFYTIALVGALLLPLVDRILPRLRGHMDGKPASVMETLGAVFRERSHWTVFAFTVTMVMASFLIIPYLAPAFIGNAGLPEPYLKHLYGLGGLATFFSARIIGLAADRYGKLPVFLIVTGISLVPIIALTQIGRTPIGVLLFFSTLFFIFVSGRMVPGLAMITGSVAPRYRGSFMSLNSALQQLTMGAGSFIAGLILVKLPDQSLGNLDQVGYLAAGSTLLCMFFARRLRSVS
ncbi:MAG: MFS transporter [Spirochaetales bacterium]|nr:MFS transporter [Spirochaetales bacterium]